MTAWKWLSLPPDDNALNHEIAEYCKAKDIMVNAVDQKADCSFIFPSYIKEKNLVAAFRAEETALC